MLPTAKTVVEVAPFGIQKIKNPVISGAECQQGDQLGSWNAGEYVLLRAGMHAMEGKAARIIY
jgi:hypothetical protein